MKEQVAQMDPEQAMLIERWAAPPSALCLESGCFEDCNAECLEVRYCAPCQRLVRWAQRNGWLPPAEAGTHLLTDLLAVGLFEEADALYWLERAGWSVPLDAWQRATIHGPALLELLSEHGLVTHLQLARLAVDLGWLPELPPVPDGAEGEVHAAAGEPVPDGAAGEGEAELF